MTRRRRRVRNRGLLDYPLRRAEITGGQCAGNPNTKPAMTRFTLECGHVLWVPDRGENYKRQSFRCEECGPVSRSRQRLSDAQTRLLARVEDEGEVEIMPRDRRTVDVLIRRRLISSHCNDLNQTIATRLSPSTENLRISGDS